VSAKTGKKYLQKTAQGLFSFSFNDCFFDLCKNLLHNYFLLSNSFEHTIILFKTSQLSYQHRRRNLACGRTGTRYPGFMRMPEIG